jgi:hypothetical protein
LKNEKIMIHANELRIGNWVRSNLTEREFQITAEDIVYINIDPSVVSPIPLTEERLLEFGFKDNSIMIDTIDKTLNISAIVGKDFYLYLDDVFGSAYDLNCIQSVHQLQNLYHALTGQELILNQELPSTFLP